VRRAGLEIAAALCALCAYLFTVLPTVRRELRRLRQEAAAIPDPALRRLALAALREKSTNVEAVAVFATLAPRPTRRAAVRAIVPLQVAIDYRDTLEELAASTGRGLEDDGGYLDRLEGEWRRRTVALPAAVTTLPLVERAVERCADGQRRTHAAAARGVEDLCRWAETLDAPPGYLWWEIAAGASSSVAAHALVAAAADRSTTAAAGAAIDAAYHPAIGALTVLLDDLVDHERDRTEGDHNYLGYYRDAEEAADRLLLIAARADAQIGRLPHGRRHNAILSGVGAFYLSDPRAESSYARPIRAHLLRAFGPATKALAAFLRLRRLGARSRSRRADIPPGP
jgi:tetraprenyl-beta-curcumene synthase